MKKWQKASYLTGGLILGSAAIFLRKKWLDKCLYKKLDESGYYLENVLQGFGTTKKIKELAEIKYDKFSDWFNRTL